MSGQGVGRRGGADPTERTALLLELLRGPADALVVPRLTALQWREVVKAAAQHHVVPLLFRRLERAQQRDHHGVDARRQLRAMFVERAFHTHRLLRDAAGAVKLLEGAGIRTMVLKGVHLASAIYPDPAMRGMADVDIMVDREHLAQADALFVAHGWGPEPRPSVDQFCEESNHLAKLTKADSSVLEIHYHIERPTSPFRIPITGLWDTARAVEVQDVKTLGLAPEELLIHLCLHASYHHQFERAPLKALVDIRAVLERFGDGFDWPRLCRLATAWGAGRFVHSTLCVGDALLDLRFSPHAIAEITPVCHDETLTDVASQFIRTEGADLPEAFIDVTDSLRWSDRARALAGAIFLPPSKMQARYDLRPGSPLVFAYYLVRPFDVLVRQGRLVASLLLRTPRAQVARRRAQARRAIADWVRAAHEDPPTQVD